MLRRTDSPPSRRELLALAGFLEEALSHIEAGEKQAVRHYAEFERRLLDIENSRLLRTLQWPGRFLGDWMGRLGQLLLHSALHPLYLKLVNPHFTADRYRLWVESEQAPGERKRTRQPLISLILPAHNPQRDWLEAAVASVLDQTYGCWQLCVCDDASKQDWVAEHFTALMSTEPRIRFVRSSERLGISGVLNWPAGNIPVSWIRTMCWRRTRSIVWPKPSRIRNPTCCIATRITWTTRAAGCSRFSNPHFLRTCCDAACT